MTATPLDFETLTWLASLRPRAELTMRIALRDTFDILQVDPVFGARIKLLLDLVDPRPAQMAAIMTEARMLERALALRDHPKAPITPELVTAQPA